MTQWKVIYHDYDRITKPAEGIIIQSTFATSILVIMQEEEHSEQL